MRDWLKGGRGGPYLSCNERYEGKGMDVYGDVLGFYSFVALGGGGGTLRALCLRASWYHSAVFVSLCSYTARCGCARVPGAVVECILWECMLVYCRDDGVRSEKGGESVYFFVGEGSVVIWYNL